MIHPDQQMALARLAGSMAGRHKAPTGAPTSTNVRVGGEGTPPARAQAGNAGRPALQANGVIFERVSRGLLPSVVFRRVPIHQGSWVSLFANKEGFSVYLRPFELALLHPGVDL